MRLLVKKMVESIFILLNKGDSMKVSELMEILKDVNGDLDINISVERGRGLSGSNESVEVSYDSDGVYISGEEDFYD